MDSLVSTEWLANELGASDLRIVDASWHLPDSGRDPAAEYEAGHIPGAVFMDLRELVDANSPVPNTLPPAEKFASRMQSLGLGDGSRIVLYDDSPVKSAARAWFMLGMFGAHDVAILDGGLAKWKGEGRPVEQGKQTLRHRHFTVWQDDKTLRTKADLLRNLHDKREQVVDARPASRFAGEDPERAGVAGGHIPGSASVPLSQLFNPDGTWKSLDEMRALFEQSGIDLAKPVVTSCGSGMTASGLAFALSRLGKEDVALYDGSWSEWGADPNTPKATGRAA
ncbi:MAG TPA: 3-mercaptopyruvate sulfurtransferase [Novosphingobium sp.]|nr:3-mercaptopyruvate sulfurtransferase [Novosphingobium sp.]